jgi:hypothetical protein
MKPNDLRAFIVAALPDFATDPERLAMWIEKGRIRSPMTASRNFEWEYTLNITLQDFTGEPAILFLVINDWLRTNQPELVQPGAKHGYVFEADVVDESTVDLHVQLDLTERTGVTANADGTDALQQLDDAACLLDDDAPIGGALTTLTASGPA